MIVFLIYYVNYCEDVCAWSLRHVQLSAAPHRDPLSMVFSRQEYWSRFPFSTPRGLPSPGMGPACLEFPALAGRFFTTSATWEAHIMKIILPNCYGYQKL